MLRITMSTSASGAAKYYSEAYYSEGKGMSEYYSEKDLVIGMWGGKAAEKLGLNHAIRKEDFAALCYNHRPDNGKTLTGRANANRTVGYDFTFNACKSLSLAYTFANQVEKEEILAAFRSSVADTMKEIESSMQARVRAKGKNENRETANIIYGEFIHFTTRPVDGRPDPHLHAHCFVLNATYDETDNKWKAGQFKYINQNAPYFEAYFHSKLAENLAQSGYHIGKTNTGFELNGVDKTTIDKFSRRTKEIEEHAKEHGITDDKEKSKIGAKTRETKRSNNDGEKELAEWQSRLTEKEQYQLSHLKHTPVDNKYKSLDAAEKALQQSFNHHLERKSVTTDKEVLASALKSSIGTANASDVINAFQQYETAIKIKENLETFVTTKEALNEEKKLITTAISFKAKYKPINEQYRFENDMLNAQQKKAIEHALTTTDGITIITGKAGTGKTTLMQEVKRGIEAAGKQIFAFAPSSEASRMVQRKEGFENADTVASLIQHSSKHSTFKHQVLWIDEAGMLSNKDLNSILEIAKAQNARVILSGDTRQHNSVERGDALRIVQQYADIHPVTVSKIQRQLVAKYRDAVKLLSTSNLEKGFKKLEDINAIKEIADPKERSKKIAEDYYQSAFKGKKPQEVLVVAPTHAEGESVTKAIRQQLKDHKVLDVQDRELTSLKSLQFTNAEKQSAENYRQGQVLSFHQNIKGVKAGSKLLVMKADDKGIIARDTTGKEYVVPVSLSNRFNVFEQKAIQITQGDKIRITGNGKTIDGKHLFNGTCYQIKGFDRQGNIRLSNGSLLSKDYGHFTTGYVMTSHASQGKTAEKIIISQSSMSFRAGSQEQFYVSVSRGRREVSIYTDDKAKLLQAVSQTTQRKSATELLSQTSTKTMDNSRLALLDRIRKRATETMDRMKSTLTKNYELSRTNRAYTGKTK